MELTPDTDSSPCHYYAGLESKQLKHKNTQERLYIIARSSEKSYPHCREHHTKAEEGEGRTSVSLQAVKLVPQIWGSEL